MIRYGDSVVLVALTAILLSNIVVIQWEISKLAVSVYFSSGVKVPLVFHSDGWSTEVVIVFVVLGGIVKASSVITSWGFTVASLEAVLTCIVKCGKCIRPCIVSMTTPLCLIKCKPIIGAVNFFFTTKCSTNLLSPIPNLSVAVANGFSNWPLATCIWKFRGWSIRRIIFWSCLFYCVQIILGNCNDVSSWVYQGIYCQVIVEIQRHIKHFLFSFQDYRRSFWEINLISLFISHQPILN